jgi:hypothetical protein
MIYILKLILMDIKPSENKNIYEEETREISLNEYAKLSHEKIGKEL